MFLHSSFSFAEADAHRDALIAAADNYRLARLARAGRRARRAGTRVTAVPPQPVARPGHDVHPEHNLDADRRYAVPR